MSIEQLPVRMAEAPKDSPQQERINLLKRIQDPQLENKAPYIARLEGMWRKAGEVENQNLDSVVAVSTPTQRAPLEMKLTESAANRVVPSSHPIFPTAA